MVICLPGVATAQLCEGAAPFTRGWFQIRADVSLNSVTSTLNAGLGVGYRFVFGQFVAGRRFIQNYGAATLLTGRAGLQASQGRLHVCPLATVGGVSGPKFRNINGYRVEVSEKNSSYGLAVGVVASGDTELRVVPTASFTREQTTLDTYEPNIQRSETFKGVVSLLDLGVGLVSRRGFSVRPDILLPLGASNSKTSYGITVSFNF